MRGYVVLPPGYTPGGRRYPVVYWFHGFGGCKAVLSRSDSATSVGLKGLFGVHEERQASADQE